MEWRLLISARRLIMVYICTKFREIISNGIKVMDRTRMFNRWRTDGQTDGRTDTQKFGGYNIIPRHFFVAGHKKWILFIFAKYRLLVLYLSRLFHNFQSVCDICLQIYSHGHDFYKLGVSFMHSASCKIVACSFINSVEALGCLNTNYYNYY